jgi:endoglucanase
VPANAAPATAGRPAAASATSSLSCTYAVPYDFSTGFVLEFTITNTGTTSVPFPTLTWTWPGTQQIIAASPQSGEIVTVKAQPSYLVIPPGGSAGFGIVVDGSLPPVLPVLPIPCTRVS